VLTVIAAQPTPSPYLAALLPSEQDTLRLFESDLQEETDEATVSTYAHQASEKDEPLFQPVVGFIDR